jgi:hypothetical protein
MACMACRAGTAGLLASKTGSYSLEKAGINGGGSCLIRPERLGHWPLRPEVTVPNGREVPAVSPGTGVSSTALADGAG